LRDLGDADPFSAHRRDAVAAAAMWRRSEFSVVPADTR
jgi:hypothetical protein